MYNRTITALFPVRFNAILLLLIIVGGCQHNRTADIDAMAAAASLRGAGLVPPTPVISVQAICAPPIGWVADPLKESPRHQHQVWLSPSGKTAYGVIHFDLPFPVGVNLVHWQFMREMKQKQGEAIDLGEDYDDKLPGLRFVCEGGLYKLRANMMVHANQGWVAYAGTLRSTEVDLAELRLAEQARENTVPGLGGSVTTAQ